MDGNEELEKGQYAFHMCVFRAHQRGESSIDLMDKLRSSGALIDQGARQEGRTALYVAAELYVRNIYIENRCEVLRVALYLVQNGANKDIRLPDGGTKLMKLVDAYETVQNLDAAKAADNRMLNLFNTGTTAKITEGIAFVQEKLDEGILLDLNCRDEDGRTALQGALLNSTNEKVLSNVTYLLNHGAAATAPGEGSQLPLQHYIWRAYNTGHACSRLLKLLVAKGAVIGARDASNSTALSLASELHGRDDATNGDKLIEVASNLVQLGATLDTNGLSAAFKQQVQRSIDEALRAAEFRNYEALRAAEFRQKCKQALIYTVFVAIVAIVAQQVIVTLYRIPEKCIPWEPDPTRLDSSASFKDLANFQSLDANCDGCLSFYEVSIGRQKKGLQGDNFFQGVKNEDCFSFDTFRAYSKQQRQKLDLLKEKFSLEDEKDCQLQRIENYFKFTIHRTSDTRQKIQSVKATLEKKCFQKSNSLSKASSCARQLMSAIEVKYNVPVPEVNCQ